MSDATMFARELTAERREEAMGKCEKSREEDLAAIDDSRKKPGALLNTLTLGVAGALEHRKVAKARNAANEEANGCVSAADAFAKRVNDFLDRHDMWFDYLKREAAKKDQNR
ncbi:MAG: hypothetical protein KF847_20915 [Pirellulales bacterium]|nr:hypothetical protein [Pirellulales bacterium]